MSKINPHKQVSPLAVRLIGAIAATALLSGTALTGAVLLPATASAAVDSDGDGLTDEFEIPNHLDPQNPDSDRDYLSDGDELHKYYTGPPTQTPKPKDTDADGLSDSDETNVYRTNPNRKDTDRDGRDDGSEVKNGINPRIPLL
jgi:Bacterial TSP3 repeat